MTAPTTPADLREAIADAIFDVWQSAGCWPGSDVFADAILPLLTTITAEPEPLLSEALREIAAMDHEPGSSGFEDPPSVARAKAALAAVTRPDSGAAGALTTAAGVKTSDEEVMARELCRLHFERREWRGYCPKAERTAWLVEKYWTHWRSDAASMLTLLTTLSAATEKDRPKP